MNSDEATTDKTEAKLALADEPAPKPAKHKAKSGRKHRRPGGALATKKARKRAPKPAT